MPDLAVLITQTLLASKTLEGIPPKQLLSAVPYQDFMAAMLAAVPHLLSELETDTRNVLLTLARIWSTVSTGLLYPKPEAANWAIEHLPKQHQAVMEQARDSCLGLVEEHWKGRQASIKPCADFMVAAVNQMVAGIRSSDTSEKAIRLYQKSTIPVKPI